MSALVAGDAGEWEPVVVDIPAPGPGQVLVRVRAAGLNRADLYMLEGKYNPAAQPGERFVAGIELAGEVVAVGAAVTGVSAGDRVMGGSRGAYASFAVADYRHLLPVPDAMSWAEAAALPVGLSTEYDALVTQGGFAAGQSVLVLGGTSGVGLIGIQLAKALGASLVAATTTSPAKAGILAKAGADRVINTRTGQLADEISSATGTAGVDITLDHLGGQVLASAFAAIRVGGTILGIGRLAGHQSTIDLDQLAYRRLRLIGTTFTIRTAEQRGEVYAAVASGAYPAVLDGRIRPIVDRVFAFEQARAAAAYARSGEAAGKIVIEF